VSQEGEERTKRWRQEEEEEEEEWWWWWKGANKG